MKTAISIPDKVYEEAEKLANSLGTSRSQLYTQALSSYIATHSRENITQRLDELYSSEPSELDKGLNELQHSSLPKEEW